MGGVVDVNYESWEEDLWDGASMQQRLNKCDGGGVKRATVTCYCKLILGVAATMEF